jgi:hypothetical protein
MNRREFLGSSLVSGPILSRSSAGQEQPIPREPISSGTGGVTYDVEITIERRREVKPHAGKMLAIQPHCDDIPIRRKLAEQGRRLPILGDDDETANRAYTKHVALRRDRLRGMHHGLEYAELFHYNPGDDSFEDDYVRENAVSL